MDHISRLKAQVFIRVFLATTFIVGLALTAWYFVVEQAIIDSLLGAIGVLTAIVVVLLTTAHLLTQKLVEPTEKLSQAILHVAPGHEEVQSSAPNLDSIKIGRELISSMALQVYQLASGTPQSTAESTTRRESLIQAVNVINHLPLPLFILNSAQQITNASKAGIAYSAVSSAELFGKPIEEHLRMEFPKDYTLGQWIEECQQNKVTSTEFWERVRITTADEQTKQCDMSAHYNRDSPSGTEFIITIFDRTERYNQDDESLSFVALAVHELRTPLTMLRGYIEVFEDELGDSLNKELQDFMHKMNVAAGQLTIFVNNILNVARIEQNQLMMNLREAKWESTIDSVLNDMDIRANINGITIERHIDSDLPTAGIDDVSIYEVIANLIDNAIKYSGQSKKIIVKSTVGKTGYIETTVQDFGVGMPPSVTENLFEKFYRNHRTRGKVGGTGLGLYLTKAIISAHGGQVWVHSKEGQGSTFGFSVVPYNQLSEELKKSGNKDIVRQSHGWIKNHSMYRR